MQLSFSEKPKNGEIMIVTTQQVTNAPSEYFRFEATTAFCKIMCDAPRLPKFPVYGSNNWYYAYGNSSHEEVAKDTEIVVNLSPKGENRPFMVIDDGWQLSHNGACTGGPWNIGNYKFPNMKGLAQEIRNAGARPGI